MTIIFLPNLFQKYAFSEILIFSSLAVPKLMLEVGESPTHLFVNIFIKTFDKFIHFLFSLTYFFNVFSPSVSLTPLTTFVTSLFAASVQRIGKDRILLNRYIIIILWLES